MRALAGLVALTLLAGFARSQHQAGHAASSATYFMAAVELGSAEDADTLLYRLRGSQGSGVVVEPHSVSPTYAMRGGFYGALSAPVLGQPWLTGSQPFFLKRTGNTTMILRGTELWLGPTPTVTIGGQFAPVMTRTVNQMQVQVPDLPVPGFQPVTFTNSAGTTTMNEGVGVLPMLEGREPMNGVDWNYFRIHATANDVVILVLGGAPGPATQYLDFEYSLLLDPQQVFFVEAFFIPDPDGKLTIPLPPFPGGLLWIQAVAVSEASNYTAGTWTNLLAM